MKKSNLLIAVLTTASLLTGVCAAKPNCCRGQDCEQSVSAVMAPAAEQPAENTPKYANAPQLSAKAGFLIEANSGAVLHEHNADARLPIASMTKVATLGVVYEALAQNQISMDEMVLVSDYAASMGGSQAFLDAGSEYAVRDLIQSIVVASANDSCVALAEKIAGSVPEFVNKMNVWAKDLGCQNTNFVNCTGLPTPGAYSCARDMAKMYAKIMQSPHYGDFNQVWMYDLTHPSGRVTGLTNTNKLIRSYNGCLGGKTGFTNEAGHCITVAAKRGDLQPIAVIIGAPDSKTRFNESRALLDFACNSFENQLIVDKTAPLAHAKVKNSLTESADLYPAANYYQLTPKGEQSNLTVATEIPDTVCAPLQPKDPVGKVFVMQDGKVLAEIPVQTNTPINEANYWQTVQKIVRQAPL